MNVRRGMIRLLIVSAGAYWLVAGLDSLDAYRSEPSATPAGAYVLKSAEGKFVTIAIDPPGTCERLLSGIITDVKKSEGLTIAPGACADSEANRETLRQRAGRKSAAELLGRYAGVFALISAAIGAIWWIAAGFRSGRQKDRA